MTYRYSGQSGPPAWLVILAGAALVFGGYFIWVGIRNYMAGTLQGFMSPTQAAATRLATPLVPTLDQRFTPIPSRTPVPACQDFVVTAREAIVRQCASTSCPIADTRREGQVVCVLERDYTADEWYIIDLDDSQFFTSPAFMHESVIRPLNPTLTPSITNTLLPTVTPLPTQTPLPTAAPTNTLDPATPPTLTPTFTPSPTPPLVSG